jgi:ankyrin repeat protein
MGTDAVRVLLEHSVDVHSQDRDGRTPLRDAMWRRLDQIQVVRLLLEHGADVNAREAQRQTPLHIASKRPAKLDVVRILLEHGADIDAEDGQGMTPLQVALAYGEGETACLLSELRSGREGGGRMTTVSQNC